MSYIVDGFKTEELASKIDAYAKPILCAKRMGCWSVC